MHSLHGNPGARKVTARKKKSPTQKKQGRARRNTQLLAQAEMLRALQKNGDENARKLGRIIRGRGDYEMGRNIGGRVGSFIGEKFHKWIKSITGFGDYEFHGPEDPTRNNTLVANDTTPSFKNEKDGCLNLIFTEWIGNKRIGPTFDVMTIPLDISSPLLAPWGYIICRRFTFGDIVGMLFFVASLLADYSATQVVGSCFGSARYDAESLPPTSKRDVMNSLFAHTDKASRNQVFAIECRKDQGSTNALKIRQPGMATGDMQLYRMGYFDLCTEGAPQSAEKAFDVSVSYHIKLYKQKLVSGSGFSCLLMDLVGATQEALKPIANTALVKQPRVNNLNISIDSANSKIFFPFDAEIGSIYLIHISRQSGGGNARYYQAQNTLFCEFVNIFDNQTSYQNRTVVSATNNAFNISIDVAVRILPGGSISVPPSVVITGAGPAVDWGLGSLTICQLDPACGSGLQALPPDIYHRSQFLEYLSSMASGDECKVAAPNLARARLIDFVEEFKREEYVDNNMIERSPVLYDVGVVEALGMLSRFLVKGRRDLHPTRFHVGTVTEIGRDTSAITEGFDHCLELNGARGEHTGSDDVPGTTFDPSISLHVKQLNPDYSFLYNVPGCTLSVAENMSIVTHREKAAWSRPGSGFVLATGAFMLVRQCLLNEDRAYHSSQVRRAILRDAARAQCCAFLGVKCCHAFVDCPGAYNLAAANLYHLRHRGRSLLGAFILGANGEATIKDDVFLACEQPCDRRTHHHRKSREAQAGARRRLTEAKERDRVSPPLYTVCRLGVDCPIPTHYHPNAADDQQYIEGTRQHRAANLVRDSMLRTQQSELGAMDAAHEVNDDPVLDVVAPAPRPAAVVVAASAVAQSTPDSLTPRLELAYVAQMEAARLNQERLAAEIERSPAPAPSVPPTPPVPLVSQHEHKNPPELKDDTGRERKEPPPRRERHQPDRRAPIVTPSTSPQINAVPAEAEAGDLGVGASISSHVEQENQDWVSRHRVVEWQGQLLRLESLDNYHQYVIDITNDTLQHRRYLIMHEAAAGRENYLTRRTTNNTALVRLHIGAQVLGFVPIDQVPPLVVVEYPELEAPELKIFERYYSLTGEWGNMGSAPGTYPDRDTFTETCPVCYGVLQFRNIVLPTCGHALCAHCTRGTLGDSTIFRCPMCRHTDTIRELDAHTHENGATHLIRINSPPLLPPEPPQDDPSDSSSEDSDESDGGDEGDEGDEVHMWEGEVIPPPPNPVPYVNPRLLMLAGLYRRHQALREPPPPRNPWQDILELANQRRARQDYYEAMVPIDFYSAPPVRHYYQRARTPYPLPQGHIWGVRHQVAASLVSRMENIIAHQQQEGTPTRRVPSSGYDAPRAPPMGYVVVGNRPVVPVTIYTTVDPDIQRPLLARILRQASRAIPLLHPTREHILADPAVVGTSTIDYVHESTTGDGHRFAFWRPDHESKTVGTPQAYNALTAIAASIYQSYRVGYIYPELLTWLQQTTDPRLLNVNSRAAAALADGKYAMREVFIAAVRRCANTHPDHAAFLANSVDYFDDTLRFYSQQQFFRSIQDLLATGTPHGLDFRVGPRSSTHSMTGARTGSGAWRP